MKKIRCIPTCLGPACGDIIVADSIGNTASLRTEHTGIELGHSTTDSTGRRVDYLASPGTQYLNPLYSADFSALQNLNDTDIRGQGYSYEGTALTPDQSLGQHTSYLGSSIVGTLTTNKDTGNDVIYAGAGDDVVNAMTLKAKQSYKSTATAQFASEKLCFNQRKRSRASHYLGLARLCVPRYVAPNESDCAGSIRHRERSWSGRRTNRATESCAQKFGGELWLVC